VRKEENIFHLDLREVNITPNVPDAEKLLSKGFFPTITVQDFPIRGHKIFLHIKRRRWLNTSTNKVAYRTIIEVLQKIPEKLRRKVTEITLGMAGNMGLIAKRCFRSAVRVTDRFHVQKLATEVL
jgi:transposase